MVFDYDHIGCVCLGRFVRFKRSWALPWRFVAKHVYKRSDYNRDVTESERYVIFPRSREIGSGAFSLSQ